jgi:hypothetical protein
MVDAGDRRQAQRARREAALLQQLEDQELDARGILPGNLREQPLEQRRQRAIRPRGRSTRPSR